MDAVGIGVDGKCAVVVDESVAGVATEAETCSRIRGAAQRVGGNALIVAHGEAGGALYAGGILKGFTVGDGGAQTAFPVHEGVTSVASDAEAGVRVRSRAQGRYLVTGIVS